MAWAITNGTYLGPGATASPAFPVPAGVSAGKLIEVNFSVTAGGAVTGVPTDFLLKLAVTSGNVTEYTYWKRASAADSGTYTFTLASSGNVSGQASMITGGTPTGHPYRVAATASAVDVASSASSPAVTAAGEVAIGDLIRFIAARSSNGTMTAPSGYTLQTGAGSQRLHVATLVQAATGTPTGIVSTWGTAAINRTAALLVLIPAPTSETAAYTGTGTLTADAHATFKTSGHWVSDPVDLSEIEVASNSSIVWNATVPSGGSVTVETSIDGGSTWAAASSGHGIPGIHLGDDLTGVSLLTRITLTGNGDTTPQVHSLTVTINQARAWHIIPTIVDEPKRFNLGVYLLTIPDRPVGQSPAIFQVQGWDKLYLLNHNIPDTYAIGTGTGYIAAMKQAIIDSGYTGLPPLIDSTRQGKALQAPRVWHGTVTPTTWLQVINDLASDIAYRGLWADPDGRLRSEPYQLPQDRPVEWWFNMTDPETDIVLQNRTYKVDAMEQLNWWLFIRDGSPTTPVEGDGLYTIDKTNGAARRPKIVKLTAADQASLVSQGDRIYAQDTQRTATWNFQTGPMPALGHFDVFALTDADLGDFRVQAASHSIPWDGSPVTITAEVVS